MHLNLNRFPGGKMKALTMSYDDGVRHDIRLIDIFNTYGIKGTFHINSGLFGKDTSDYRLSRDEIKQVYAGHEISAHGYTHQSLSVTPDERIVSEVMLDREKLEEITGRPVRGMSYANGSVNDNVVNMLPMLGIEYCRVTKTTGEFALPENFLRWEGTCHHRNNLLALGDKFLSENPKWAPWLMYVWGHSYEFNNDNNWDLIEEFCKKTGGRENEIWYATNMEICDYIKAVRALKFSAKQDIVLNQSAIDVWISVGTEPIEIKGGAVVKL